MLPLVIPLIRAVATCPLTTAGTTWLGRFSVRVVARQLQVPEALVHDAGFYIYTRIDLFERALLSGLFGKT